MTDPKDASATPASSKSKSKERSPNYPALTLTAAIGLVSRLYDKEKRTSLSMDSMARALEYKSLSGPARTAIATLRQYGLIEPSGDGLKVSDLAIEIIHQPDGSLERREAVRLAAKRPALISELALTHADASDESLKAFLITRKKFGADGAARFVMAFRDALELANMESFAERLTRDKDAEQGTRGSSNKPGINPNTSPPQFAPPKPGPNIMQFTWVLSGDAVATLNVSREIEPDDVQTLEDSFAAAVRALKKHAERRQAASQQSEVQSGA